MILLQHNGPLTVVNVGPGEEQTASDANCFSSRDEVTAKEDTTQPSTAPRFTAEVIAGKLYIVSALSVYIYINNKGEYIYLLSF